MNLLCGAIKNLWNEFYNNCVRNLDDRTKFIIGASCVLGAIVIFIFCTKGKDKAGMINNWFLFWVSIIVMVVGVFYLTN